MPPKREIRNVLAGKTANEKIVNGAQKIYDAVSSTYGPDGNNVLLGMPFGDPVLTRDGVTVAKRVSAPNVGFEDRCESDAASILRQASEKTNKTAGDATTATIVVGYHLFMAANQRILAGEKARIIKRQLEDDSRALIDWVKKQSVDAKGHLVDVATVSSGDANIGQMVAELMEEVGLEGGVSIREQTYPTIDVEKVNGYYFDKGFFALNQQIEYEKPHIFVTQKRLSSNADIVPLLNVVIQSDTRKLVVIGDVSGDALNTMIANVINGKLDAVVIPPPAYGDEAKLFMEDIAIYTKAHLFTDADAPNSVTVDMFGKAARVQVSQDRAIVFDGAGNGDEIVQRASEIKNNIDKETNEHKKDQLEQRYSRLVGKIAIVNVGGSTQAEMEELKFRVEDALEAVKSAMSDGVLPGGATTIVKASQEVEISDITREAIEKTFIKLMDNAAEPATHRLKQVKGAKFGFGFNLREMTDEPIDLRTAGIWDATRAVVQTLENGASAAGALLTTGAIVHIVEPEADEAKS